VEEDEDDTVTTTVTTTTTESIKGTKPKVEDPKIAAIRNIKLQERENMQTKVVKIAMVDKREASTATHAYFSTGNIAMNIPLDVFVEMPKILIKQAEESMALVHVDNNGTTIPKLQKRYVIEYKR